ncbi:MAG: L,D-transpeptidase family protein, partial [Ferruginibacter sp.]
MNHFNWKNKVAILIACLYSFSGFTQITPGELKQFISVSKYTGNTEIREFYARMNYNTTWIQNENTLNRSIFLNTLKLSGEKGLRESDYLPPFSENSPWKNNVTDSMEAELRITEAAIKFYNDIAYGNTKTGFGYNGLDYIPGCKNIPQLLADHILKNELQLLITRVSPPFPEISAIENKIRWFINVMSDSNFRETSIISTKKLSPNIPLISKLYQLGIIESATTDLPDSTLKKKIKEAQQLFNLLPDGVLRSTILQELNIPLSVRLKQLNLSVNYYRWLYCLLQNQSVIVVNIPAAYLKVYHNKDIVLEMRVIAGKRSTPTPTLASTVNEVILYPYWHVPYRIATKEL